MKYSTSAVALFSVASCASAFTPSKTAKTKNSLQSSIANNNGPDQKAIYDPLGLYPTSSQERQNGQLQPLETATRPVETNSIKDPLNLYKDASAVDDKPIDEASLSWQQTAEVKHARLAMMAAVGWPVSELLDKKVAAATQLTPLLDASDRVPSVLNGGLLQTPAFFWAATLGVAFALESMAFIKEKKAASLGVKLVPGDLGFDPLQLSQKLSPAYVAEAELFNGRLAMLAITGFALQEWWLNSAVVHETPFFFQPPF